MWKVNGIDIQMTEGDYGIALPITIEGIDWHMDDSLSFAIKDKRNGNTLVHHLVAINDAPTMDIVLSRSESDSLRVGTYVYALDWGKGGQFSCNIIPNGTFKVVNRA